MQNTSLNCVIQFFDHIEQKYNLIDYEIEGVYFWKLIRYSLWERIVEKTGLMGVARPLLYSNKIEKMVKMAKRDFEIIKYNAQRYNKKRSIMIFQKSRKSLYKGEEVDVLSNFFIEELAKNNFFDYEVFETDTFSSSYYKRYHPKIALKPIYLQKIMTFFTKISLNDEDKSILKEISEEIEMKFGVKVDLINMSTKAIEYFKQQYKYYKKLFKKISPRIVILLASQSKASLIAAAHANEIKVLELQHGSISKNHLGYSFPNNTKVPYFPDKLLTFGEYWRESTRIPIKDEDIHIIGYPYLIERLNENRHLKKEKDSVVFISQGIIAKKLIDIAIEFAKKYPEYNICYKLHPSEYSDYKRLYPNINSGRSLKNFRVIDNNYSSLHEILAKSEFQVGVGSTAILEGLCLNCKTILVDLPGVEEMEFLIDKQIAMKAKCVGEVYNCITNFSGKPYDRNYFFADLTDMPLEDILKNQ